MYIYIYIYIYLYDLILCCPVRRWLDSFEGFLPLSLACSWISSLQISFTNSPTRLLGQFRLSATTHILIRFIHIGDRRCEITSRFPLPLVSGCCRSLAHCDHVQSRPLPRPRERELAVGRPQPRLAGGADCKSTPPLTWFIVLLREPLESHGLLRLEMGFRLHLHHLIIKQFMNLRDD